MKIKFNNTSYDVESVNYTGSFLAVTFTDKTAEEVKTLLSNKEGLAEIEVLDDTDTLMSKIIGYCVLSHVDLTDVVTGYLMTESTFNEQKLTELGVNSAEHNEEIETNASNIDYLAMESGVEL